MHVWEKKQKYNFYIAQKAQTKGLIKYITHTYGGVTLCEKIMTK
jgi:hypothetical protein